MGSWAVGPAGLGSMLGGDGAEKDGAAAGSAGGEVMMPEGFEDVRSIKDIMAKAGPRDRFQAMMAFIEGIDSHEIEGALAEIRAGAANQFDPEAMFASHLLLMRWGEEDPEAAFASLQKIGMMERAFGSMSVLAAVASTDPQAAADWLMAPDNLMAMVPRAGDFMATTVTKEWAKRDPDAALAWAKGLPEGKRAGAYNGVLGSLAADDPQRASQMAMELEAGKDRENLIGNIAESWSKKSPAEAMAWAQGLEAGKERDTAISKSLGGWAQAAPLEAAAFLDQMGEEEKAAHVGAVAGRGLGRPPREPPLGWRTRRREKARTRACARRCGCGAATEPAAASTWLASQPEGPSRDHGIVSLASTTFDEDPASAVTWAAAISDEQMRQEHVNRGVTRWLKDEPEAATQWLQSNDVLSQEERQQFLQPEPEPEPGE